MNHILMKDLENYCSVYLLFDNVGIRYVGVSVNPEHRLKMRKYQSYNKNGKEYNLRQSRWFRKYENQIRMRVVFEGCEEECYSKEIELIQKCRLSGRDLVNVSDGGNRPPRINTLENFEEIREKIRKKSLNRHVSDETKVKMSLSHKGKCNHLYKIHASGKDNTNAKGIEQYDINGDFIKSWSTLKEAADFFGIKSCSLCDNLKGRTKTCKKFIWKYS